MEISLCASKGSREKYKLDTLTTNLTHQTLDVAEIKLRGTPRLLTSAHRGVSWAARPKRWRAQIRTNGLNKHIGYFKDEKSAHEAYIAARTACDLAASEPRLPTIVSTMDLVSMLEADPTDASLPRRKARSNR